MPSTRRSGRPAALRHGTGLSATRKLHDAGFAPADYLALVDALTLEPVTQAPARLLAAARLGTTRLIDNLAVE